MRSNISLRKMLELTWKKQIWVFALSCLGFFLSGPVITLMAVTSWEEAEYYHRTQLRTLFSEMLGGAGAPGSSPFQVFFVLVLAAIACISAWNGFSYLHGKRKTDFFHALPIRREKLYLLQVFTGMLNYVLPALVSLVLVEVIGLIHGLAGADVPVALLRQFLMGLVFYLLLYLTAALAMLLTGRLLVGMLGTAIFFGIIPLILLLGQAYMEVFFTTGGGGSWRYLSRSDFLQWSAFGACMSAAAMPWRSRALALTVQALAADAILFVLCGWLHRIRPSQSAEKSMAFKPVGEAILVILSVVSSLAMGMIFRSVSMRGDGWMIFGLLFGALLTYAVIRMIYHLDIRRIFAGKVQLGLTLGLTLLVVAFFRFDLLGYDSYLPRQSEIESIGFGREALSINDWSYGSEQSVMENMNLPCTDETYAMLERLVTGHKIYLQTYLDHDTEMEEKEYESCYQDVYVRLKNGGTYERTFQVYAGDVREQLAALYDMEAFKERVFGFLTCTDGNVASIDLLEPGYELDGEWIKPTASVEKAKDRKALMEALRLDLLDMSSRTVLEESPVSLLQATVDIGSLSEEALDEDGDPIYRGYYAYSENGGDYYTITANVYPSFTRTLAVLDDLKLRQSLLQDAKNVKRIEIFSGAQDDEDQDDEIETLAEAQTESDAQRESGDSILVEQPGEIEAMLAVFCPNEYIGLWQYGKHSAMVVCQDEDGDEVRYYGVLM